MNAGMNLSSSERATLLGFYRRHADPQLRLRAHIILLLEQGLPWAAIAAVLFCSTRTIARWQKRFQEDRLPALFGQPRGVTSRLGGWMKTVIDWVLNKTPRDFGFLRSRWCCEVIVVLLFELHQVQVSRETVRRWLICGGLVYRRPRPVVGPQDPEKADVLKNLRSLLRNLPANETAVWQDEVDVNTNPKIGAMWMRRGQQAHVVTPGNNDKRYLAGCLNWRTGDMILTESLPRQGRNADLFLRHLDDVRRRLRRYAVIHVICDNAKAHDCRKVQAYLQKWGHRIKIHYLPKYAPETNPIERIWWHLHEEITRNHRCKTIEELIDLTFTWLEERRPFKIEGSLYPKPQARRMAA
jgi:putative transposase